MPTSADCVAALQSIGAPPASLVPLVGKPGYAYQAVVFESMAAVLATRASWAIYDPAGLPTYPVSAGGTYADCLQLSHCRSTNGRTLVQEASVVGYSGALHQLDIAYVRTPVQGTTGYLSGHPGSLGLAFECKHYARHLSLDVAREVVGLAADLRERSGLNGRRVCLVTSSRLTDGAWMLVTANDQIVSEESWPVTVSVWGPQLAGSLRFQRSTAAGATDW